MPHISRYLKAIEKALAAGNATEHTHRPALQALVESVAEGVTATNEPKRVKCGAPDYIVTRGATPLGYIEAKDVGKSLDREERSEQMRRYLEGLDNLLLTDYLEFRWYVRGEQVQVARLGTFDAGRERVRLEPKGAEEVGKLLEDFLTEVIPTINSPKELAERMARVARLIRDTISRAFKTEGAGGSLHEQMKGFRTVLLHDLTEEQFADMYAQTICYGLFAARVNHRGSEPFTRRDAAHELPRTNPFLRKLFQHVAGPDLDDELHAWAVDGLADLLNRTDIGAILKDFGRSTRREDPVVHFYETFLAAYDPAMREARGVYYTPEPVVSYIVRSVDHILKTDFKLPDGLADASKIKVRDAKGKTLGETHKVLLLDPATGTGTFLYGVINHIYETFKRNQGMWSGYVSEHLLPRLFGFELLMAPYAVAHMKLGLQLAETGYDFQKDERLRVYLTNTLEEAHEVSRMPLFTQWLAAEANEASRVKQEAPVMVVLGNPPYSVSSQNKGDWIGDLIDDYKKDLNEKKLNLDDDFIKFIRFAQWRIEQTGYGILAFITNHTYLDGLTHRRMRGSLMETFDDIYILDLHGNTKKKERSPDGSKDENVFDIQQGVSIGIFVKKPNSNKACVVRHSELWGTRQSKYECLFESDITNTAWTELRDIKRESCLGAFRFFTPKAFENIDEYCDGWNVKSIFPINQSGVKTDRDELFFDLEENKLKDRMHILYSQKGMSDSFREEYRVTNSSSYNLPSRIQNTSYDQDKIVRCLYWPYDERWLYYDPKLISRPAWDVMKHMLSGKNIGLLAKRQCKQDPFSYIWCTTELAESSVFESAYANNILFPLYLYSDENTASLFDKDNIVSRPNFAPEFIEDFSGRLKMKFIADGKGDRRKTFGPEDVFDYMYAVFHSPTYRSRYAEFLKIDFPRLPLTADAELFRTLCALGAELVGLHLMEQHAAAVADYPVKGDNIVEAVRYTEPGQGAQVGRVWINKEQYFENVTPEVWAFHVGGYQVCQKWLKDRKGRKLTFDDLAHYQRIVAALAATIRLMAEIDAVIDEHGGWPLGAQ